MLPGARVDFSHLCSQQDVLSRLLVPHRVYRYRPIRPAARDPTVVWFVLESTGSMRTILMKMATYMLPETRGGSFALVHSARCVISAFGGTPGLQIPADPARRARSNGRLVCFGSDRIDENPPDENGHIHVARDPGGIFRTCAVSTMCCLGFWCHTE